MKIEYKEIKEFSCEELEKLFLSVNWESGKYPEKLQRAMKNSSVVVKERFPFMMRTVIVEKTRVFGIFK